MSQDHVLGTQDEVVVVAPWATVGRILGSGRKPGALPGSTTDALRVGEMWADSYPHKIHCS